MASGTTGAPRNTPGPGVPARDGDTREAQDRKTNIEPDTGASRPPGPRRSSRLISIVCGRRSKYLVVVFWLLVVAVTGSLAGKLQGAEKNDASAYLPASAESTQELNEQAVFQSKNYNPALVVYVRDSGVTSADLAKARADAQLLRRAIGRGRAGRAADRVQGPQGDRDRRRL